MIVSLPNTIYISSITLKAQINFIKKQPQIIFKHNTTPSSEQGQQGMCQ